MAIIVNHKAFILFDTIVSNDSGSSSDIVAVIGGAVGGVILLLTITVVLCIVIVCMRRCHRERDYKVTYNTTKLNTDVTIDNNPSYDVTKANTLDHSCSTINPGGSDVLITINPSYNVLTKPYSKTSEDDYNSVQPNELVQHSNLEDTIKMDTNLSYEVSTGKDRETAFSTTVKISDTTKQYDYDYVCDGHLLHHNISANTTRDVKGDNNSPNPVDEVD